MGAPFADRSWCTPTVRNLRSHRKPAKIRPDRTSCRLSVDPLFSYCLAIVTALSATGGFNSDRSAQSGVVNIFTTNSSVYGGVLLGKPVEYKVNHDCLYRYGAPDLFWKGCVRITTLGACRAAADQHFGDAQEGSKTTGTQTTIDPFNPELPAAAKLAGRDHTDLLVGTPATARRDPAVFLLNERVEDAYIFCASRTYTAPMRTKFGDAVMITKPHDFIELLDKELRQRAACDLSACVVDDVQYHERVVNLEAGVKDAAFVKPLSYSEECEVRALWIPAKGAQIQPINFTLPTITEFLAAI